MIIQRNFRFMRLLLFCQRRLESLPHDSQMRPLDHVHFVREATIRNQYKVPGVGEESEDVFEEVNPVIRGFAANHFCPNKLKKRSAGFILFPIPAEKLPAYVFQQISVMRNENFLLML